MPHPRLIAHNAQFEKRVFDLAPGVWTAVGFAASNVHMIEGDTSVTIIDTSESTKAAENILQVDEFRSLVEEVANKGELNATERALIYNLLEAGETEPSPPTWTSTVTLIVAASRLRRRRCCRRPRRCAGPAGGGPRPWT